MNDPKPLGAILAGGESRRMGSDKAAQFAARARDALAPLVREVVVLGHGRGCPPELRRIDDIAGLEGPAAGLSALEEDTLVVPCDLPRITTTALRPLVVDRDQSTRFESGPLPAYITARDLDDVRTRARAGERRLRALVDVRALEVPLGLGPHLDDADTALDADPRVRRTRVESRGATRDDHVAFEAPLEFQIGGVPFAVVMRTPGNDEELARGFVLSEAIAVDGAEIVRVAHCTMLPEGAPPEAEGNVIQIELTSKVDLERLRRNLFASSSCGVCGKASIEQAMKTRAKVGTPLVLDDEVVVGLPAKMRAAQSAFEITGGLHAAALFDARGNLLCLREDVGRHNAVDKVIGWAAQNACDLDACALQVSGRVSFEIVQKSANVGISLISAVSAPTSLAVDAARALGVTLLGFVRDGRYNRYV